MQYDVFISYSRKDYVDDKKNIIPDNVVSKIKDTLSQEGISYWFDEEGIYSGNNFVDKIVNNIENSEIFIFLSTENSNKSRWTCKEIASADELGKYIIPVRIDNTPYNKQVLFRIADISYIDYFNNPEKGVEELINSIKSYLNQLQEEAKRKAEEEQRKLEIEKKKKEEEINKKKQEQLINTIKLSCSTLNNQEEKLEIDRKNLLLQTDEITDANLRDSLRQLIADGGCIHQEYQKKFKSSNEEFTQKEAEIAQKDIVIVNQNEEILRLNKEIKQLSKKSQNNQHVEERLKQIEDELSQKDDIISEQKIDICKITKEKEQVLQQARQADQLVIGLKKQLTAITESREEIEHTKKGTQRIFLLVLIPLVITLFSGTIRIIKNNSRIEQLERDDAYYREQVVLLRERRDELNAKVKEYEDYIGAIKFNKVPLLITEIDIANTYKGGKIENDSVMNIYSLNTMYLRPCIKYIGLSSGSKELQIKWYNADGSLKRNVVDSPANCTLADKYNISLGHNTLYLHGWGSENKGSWDKGEYRIEIWYEDYILGSKIITIY